MRNCSRSLDKYLIGKKFNKLTVIDFAYIRENHRYYHCICECTKKKVIKGTYIKTGRSKSCGCLRINVITKHGFHDTSINQTWRDMWQRCYNPKNRNYKWYGKRGIKVCSKWKDFVEFLKDVGLKPSEKHTLERINNNKDYEPGNVKWATKGEQNRNTSRNRFLTYKERTLCFADWAKELGFSRNVIGWRINHGWSVEKTLTTPKKIKYKL